MNIRDIAAAAHVSVSTVSKIINHKDAEISDATRQKVLKIIKEYQYTPYSNLRDFSAGYTTQTLAFLIQPDILNPKFIFHAEQAAFQWGYSLIVCNVTEPFHDSIRKYMKIMDARKVQGILLGLSSADFIKEAVKENTSRIPMAAISSSPVSDCTVFHYDHQAIAEKAVSHLIQLGHKKIGCILDTSDPSRAAGTVSGYEKAMLSLAHQGNQHFILKAGNSYDELYNGIYQMLHSQITGFYCQTVSLANAVYEVSKEGKYYIPNTISVICGETSSQARYFLPALTSYSISVEEMCTHAIEYLVSCIETRNTGIPKNFTFEPEYTRGASTATPACVGKQILVVGNCNTDITIHTSRIPQSGDLLTTNSLMIIPGGKGVNQAVGAGKLGGSVYALGCVGNDAEGNDIYTSLKEAYVHVEGITTIPSASTGKAFICVPEKGNSTVVSYPGANQLFHISNIRPFRHLFDTARYCLLSTELDWDLITYVIRKCEKNNIELFVKPSSIQSFPWELLSKVTYFVPNESELNTLFPGEDTVPQKAERIFNSGCQNVIVTLGSNGCYLKNSQYAMHIPAASFNAADTTGAANCFIAAMAVALSKESPLLYSICYATYAAGLSVTQEGVLTSFPDKSQVDIYADEIQEMYLSLLTAR